MPYRMPEPRSIFSAAESGIGFIYQPRLALLRLLSLPESTSLLIEKGDDLGSGLIDQIQKITVAAMQMAEKKVWAHRS